MIENGRQSFKRWKIFFLLQILKNRIESYHCYNFRDKNKGNNTWDDKNIPAIIIKMMIHPWKLYLTDDDGARYVIDTSFSIVENQPDKKALFVL